MVKRDHAGIRIQYQGDRTQALVHLPDSDEKGITEEAVRAAAMRTAFEVTLKETLPAAKPLQLAVGVDIGTTLASKLGAHGQHDRICIGDPVDGGAAIQQACDGDEVGISSATYHAIRKSWQKLAEAVQLRRGPPLLRREGVTQGEARPHRTRRGVRLEERVHRQGSRGCGSRASPVRRIDTGDAVEIVVGPLRSWFQQPAGLVRARTDHAILRERFLSLSPACPRRGLLAVDACLVVGLPANIRQEVRFRIAFPHHYPLSSPSAFILGDALRRATTPATSLDDESCCRFRPASTSRGILPTCAHSTHGSTRSCYLSPAGSSLTGWGDGQASNGSTASRPTTSRCTRRSATT